MIDRLRTLSRWMAWVAGAALIATAFLVSLEVVLRRVFLIGLNLGTEISSYVLAIVASWGFAYALLQRAHVRVDALIRLVPGRIAAWSDPLALACLTGFAGLLLWYGYASLAESWDLNARAMTPLGTKLWIPQSFWVGGLAIFFISCLVLLARSLILLAQGRNRESRALIGTISVEEESLSEVKEFLKKEKGAAR
jgi:TRAP-type C4-dicarboxylate transport system permease small subunit